MKIPDHVRQISTITDAATLSALQTACKQYDWNHDPCLKLNKMRKKGSDELDPAFNDSHVIHFTYSSLICHVRSSYRQAYTDSTLKLIELGDIISSEVIQLFPNYYHFKSHFVAIEPGGKQIRHIDSRFYHEYSRRLAIPIITTSLAQTNYDDATYHLEAGTLYELNNCIPHWSENHATEHRVFMFMDIIPPENLEIIKKLINYIE
jgi:aspartyl/asparaginyl beta-hydroxylase (cupin superfamily)